MITLWVTPEGLNPRRFITSKGCDVLGKPRLTDITKTNRLAQIADTVILQSYRPRYVKSRCPFNEQNPRRELSTIENADEFIRKYYSSPDVSGVVVVFNGDHLRVSGVMDSSAAHRVWSMATALEAVGRVGDADTSAASTPQRPNLNSLLDDGYPIIVKNTKPRAITVTFDDKENGARWALRFPPECFTRIDTQVSRSTIRHTLSLRTFIEDGTFVLGSTSDMSNSERKHKVEPSSITWVDLLNYGYPVVMHNQKDYTVVIDFLDTSGLHGDVYRIQFPPNLPVRLDTHIPKRLILDSGDLHAAIESGALIMSTESSGPGTPIEIVKAVEKVKKGLEDGTTSTLVKIDSLPDQKFKIKGRRVTLWVTPDGLIPSARRLQAQITEIKKENKLAYKLAFAADRVILQSDVYTTIVKCGDLFPGETSFDVPLDIPQNILGYIKSYKNELVVVFDGTSLKTYVSPIDDPTMERLFDMLGRFSFDPKSGEIRPIPDFSAKASKEEEKPAEVEATTSMPKCKCEHFPPQLIKVLGMPESRVPYYQLNLGLPLQLNIEWRKLIDEFMVGHRRTNNELPRCPVHTHLEVQVLAKGEGEIKKALWWVCNGG